MLENKLIKALFLYLSLCCGLAFAAPTTTTIADTINKSGGGFCSGTLTVFWTSLYASDGSFVATGSKNATVATNGTFSVVVDAPNSYTITYNLSASGCVLKAETWNVPYSMTPLTLAQVRCLACVTPEDNTYMPVSFLTPAGATSGQSICFNGTFWAPGGCASGSGITQLTGDVTAGPGSGAQVATLPTVNANVGSCGDATHVSQITLNAKGQATGCLPVAITGSGGGSVFTGSTATNPAFSATPVFSLADISVKSPVRFEPGVLTANVTAVTFSNKTAGAKFSIAWAQDGTGGRTINYGASATNTCTITPTASITTTQQFEVGADGATVNGVGCVNNASDDLVRLGQANTFTSGGTLDLSASTAATAIKLPTDATYVNNDCAKLVNSGGKFSIGDAGAACGSGGSPGVGRITTTVAFASPIADGASADSTFTWTGVSTSDVALVSLTSVPPGLPYISFTSASNTVTVRMTNNSGAPVTPGTLTVNGVLAVYNLTGSASLTFTGIPDGACGTPQTFTLTGAAANSPIAPQWPAALEVGVTGIMNVSATNTVQVNLCNYSGGPYGSATHTYGASIAN